MQRVISRNIHRKTTENNTTEEIEKEKEKNRSVTGDKWNFNHDNKE